MTHYTFTVPIKVETSYTDLKEIIMTDVYKQEEIHEETIAQRDARLKKANETARREEILGLMSQLNPTTGEVALCGDVAGHEFHGNQYTGGGSGGGGDHADREDERVAKRHEKEEYDHGIGHGKYADKSPREANKLLKERKAQIEKEERDRTKSTAAAHAAKDSPERAKAEGAATPLQHAASREYHMGKASEYPHGSKHEALHLLASALHDDASKGYEPSSVAHKASAAAHAAEDSHRSGKK